MINLRGNYLDTHRLRQLLERTLVEHASFDDYEMTHDFTKIGRRTMQLNARRIRLNTGEAEWILLAIEDITDAKNTAEAGKDFGRMSAGADGAEADHD